MAEPEAQRADGTQSVEVIAKLLNLTPRHLQRLAAEGHIPKASRGRYELVPVVQGYVRYLQNLVAARGNDELSKEQLRLARERADRMARENQMAEGQLIPREDVVAGVQETFAYVRARALAMPSKLAPVLANLGGKPQTIREKLTDAVHEWLDELARTRAVPVSEAPNRPGDGGSHDGGAGSLGAAAEADGERVGGSEPGS